MRNDLAEILFRSFLREVIVSSSGIGAWKRPLLDVVHLSFPADHSSPGLHGALKDRLERLSGRVTFRNHGSFGLLAEPEGVPVDPRESLSRFAPSRWSCAARRCGEVSSVTLSRKTGSLFPQSAGSRVSNKDNGLGSTM